MSAVTAISRASDAIGDPVVSGIRSFRNDDAVDQRTFGQAHEGVGDEMDRQGMPLGDAEGLILHGAGVGIDVDRRMAGLGFGFAAHAAAV